MLAGCVSVPIFASISEEHFLYQINQTGCKAIFVSGRRCHDICHKQGNLFSHIISLDQTTEFPKEMFYKELFITQEFITAVSADEYLNRPEDMASIVYTSGTSAEPKGVELTHRNMVHELPYSVEKVQMGMQDRFLHYLSQAHIFGRVLNLTLLLSNCSIYYVEEVSKILEESRSIQPTLIVLLPRMIEKLFNSISQKIETEHWPKRVLVRAAFQQAQQTERSWWTSILQPLFNSVLYNKIHHIYGDSLRFIITGSAKANPKLLTFFQNVGLPIVDGYGLTEACPAITNSIAEFKIGFIGKPMPEVEVKISDKGEILLRGPTVMRGYYKNPALNQSKIDSEGWFYTGDRGSINVEGYVTFEGRLNEVCKTSYGEFVDPHFLEEKLNQLAIVDSSIVIADDKPYVTCLLFIDKESVGLLKQRIGLPDLSDEETLKMDLVKKDFARNLEDINSHMDKGLGIRDYRFIFHKPSIEEGELTPSLKMRRFLIQSKFKGLIDDMYPQMSEGTY